MKSLRSVLFCLAVFAGTCLLGEEREYKVDLKPDNHVGDRFEISISGKFYNQRQVISEAKVTRSSVVDVDVSISGTETVKEVNDLKQITKCSFMVKELVIGKGGRDEESIPKGKEILCQRVKGKQQFLVDGKPLSRRLTRIIGGFLSTTGNGRTTTEDDLFAPPKPQKVKASWPINKEPMVKEFEKRFGSKIDREGISGKATLDSIKMIQGVECLQIAREIRLRGMPSPLPPGFKQVHSDIHLQYVYQEIADGSKDSKGIVLSGSNSKSVDFEAEGKPSPDAPPVKVRTKERVTLSITRKKL